MFALSPEADYDIIKTPRRGSRIIINQFQKDLLLSWLELPFLFMLQRVDQLQAHITAMSTSQATSDINLYTTQTPNGIKISITLEELGLAPNSQSLSPYTPLHTDLIAYPASRTRLIRSTSQRTLRRNHGFSRSILMAVYPPSQIPIPTAA